MDLPYSPAPPLKRCRKCGVLKSLQHDFGIDNITKDGRSARCITCKRAESAAYRAQHPDKVRTAVAQWAAKNPDKIHAYTEAHKNEKRARGRKRYLDNKPAINAEHAAWYEANKAERKKSIAAWEAAHKAERKARKAAQYAANPTAWRAREAAWLAEHPSYGGVKWQRRRARQAGAAIIDLTPEQFEEIKQAFQYRCAYCPDTCQACKKKTHTLHQEHIEPVVKGGNYTVHNIVPACNECNAKKGTGPPPKAVQPLLLTVAPSHTKKKP